MASHPPRPTPLHCPLPQSMLLQDCDALLQELLPFFIEDWMWPHLPIPLQLCFNFLVCVEEVPCEEFHVSEGGHHKVQVQVVVVCRVREATQCGRLRCVLGEPQALPEASDALG